MCSGVSVLTPWNIGRSSVMRVLAMGAMALTVMRCFCSSIDIVRVRP